MFGRGAGIPAAEGGGRSRSIVPKKKEVPVPYHCVNAEPVRAW